MSEKFTSGPWHIRKPRKGHRICHSILDKNGDGIAITIYRGHNGERVANDRLIASAPDMYKKLGDCAAVISDLLDAIFNYETVPDTIIAEAQDEIDEIHAVMTKAAINERSQVK